MIPVFKNFGKGLLLKTTTVSFLSAISEVLETLVNYRFVDDLEKFDLFSDLQYGFRPS